MTDETKQQDAGQPGAQTVSVELQQRGTPPTSATATVAPAHPNHGHGLLSQIVLKFIDPSSLASLASTGVGLWMIVNQPDREITAWALIAAGGLLVPAIGIAKRLAGGTSGADPK